MRPANVALAGVAVLSAAAVLSTPSASAKERDFGDGTRSRATTDPGGLYPVGGVRHTYLVTRPAVRVRVDARFTGWFRINGGGWQPLQGTADLQNEPVTTTAVRQVTSRL